MKWQYYVTAYEADLCGLNIRFDKLGAAGWELVGTSHVPGSYLFKRPLTEPDVPPGSSSTACPCPYGAQNNHSPGCPHRPGVSLGPPGPGGPPGVPGPAGKTSTETGCALDTIPNMGRTELEEFARTWFKEAGKFSEEFRKLINGIEGTYVHYRRR